MAKREQQKVKGCKKCGRSKRKGNDTNLSLFVKNKITAEQYFKVTNQAYKKV